MNPRPALASAVVLTALVLAACHEAPPPPAPKAPTSVPAPAATVPVAAQGVDSAPLLRSTHANYAGRLPCEDCRDDRAQLTLQRDELGRNSYVLKETIHRADGETTPVETGQWRIEMDRRGEPPLALLHLESGRPGQARIFSVAMDGSLEPLDGNAGESLKPAGGNLDLAALANAEPGENPATGDRN